ncbi:MAG: dihydropyrimidinase [Lachnospiraceae bacterium]|nr:dihydropyrimidinase [Lachnospiraceae bacterium]
MILLQGGTVVSATEHYPADVLIDGEKIAGVFRRQEISATQVADAQIIDVTGKLLFPGFIDAHTHFDLHVAGTVTADDFASGSRAAVAGGTTCVIDMGTQYKGETLRQGMENWLEKAKNGVSCDYGIHMSITDWNEEASRQCRDMMDAGVTTFKIYMTYDLQLTDREIFEILCRLKEVGGITGCHCENAGVIDALRAAYSSDERIRKVSSHYLTRPPQAEAEAIGRYLYIAEIADCAVIDVHLTCEAGLEEIRAARKRGVRVYAETCPQYLTFDDSCYELAGFEGAKYVCAPPLRKKSDQEALWAALATGEIQTVCTDHCPFTLEQKRLGIDDFKKIPGGMPGVETRGEIMYTEGVVKGRITAERYCAALSENVARLYGLYPQKGVIAKDSDADIVVLDPARKKTITSAAQVSRCDYTPYEGKEITGVVEKVFLRGTLCAEEGRVVKENTGRFVRRHGSEGVSAKPSF